MLVLAHTHSECETLYTLSVLLDDTGVREREILHDVQLPLQLLGHVLPGRQGRRRAHGRGTPRPSRKSAMLTPSVVFRFPKVFPFPVFHFLIFPSSESLSLPRMFHFLECFSSKSVSVPRVFQFRECFSSKSVSVPRVFQFRECLSSESVSVSRDLRFRVFHLRECSSPKSPPPSEAPFSGKSLSHWSVFIREVPIPIIPEVHVIPESYILEVLLSLSSFSPEIPPPLPSSRVVFLRKSPSPRRFLPW